jgi:YYY domain-containing protein
MTAFLSWYALVTLLGWLTFPLAYRLFPALADRGYALARVAGLLIWGYLFWLLTSLGLTRNTAGGMLFSLLILIGLSAWALMAMEDRPGTTANGPSSVLQWLRSNLRPVVAIEVLFLAAFAFLALLRAGNPELDGTERPMELMFINAILRSPAFPPHDSWLSGYAISYYYFGYVLTAMLAKLAGVPATIAHNLMTALVFALAAVGAYGILYDLLGLLPPPAEGRKPSTVLPFLAPLFLLLAGNLGGFLEVLHTQGIFWNSNPSNFWTWLGIRELSDAPSQPFQWMPDRYLWWWRASRVISDFDLRGNFQEVIDEFPFFSFLLGDLHPHVLAIPFNLLAAAIALNICLGGWPGETNLFGLRLKISRVGFGASALTLGGLAFLNTWDILPGAVLIVGAYVLLRVREAGWSWARLEDLLALGFPLGVSAVLLYLPFYFGFSSQAGGILPNLVNPTRGAQLWVMFAPLFLPIMAYLLHLALGEKQAGRWLFSLWLVAGFALLLWGFSWLLSWWAFLKDSALAQNYLASQGMTSVAELFKAAAARRLSSLGGLLTLIAILVPALALLLAGHEPGTDGGRPKTRSQQPSASAFVLLLILLGTLLVLAPEFVYLHDQFSDRMNTIFKFYYQAWSLFGLAAAFGTAVLLQRLRGAWDWLFRICLMVLLFMSLTYPALAIPTKTNGFKPAFGWTLDDFTRVRSTNPDEAAAIDWLKSAPEGVVAEAVGGSYTGYARISTYTGLPAVLGWPGHESQWRGAGAPQGTRQNDIALLYATADWPAALGILKKYDIRYVYIGALEHASYPVQEDKFKRHLLQVFQQGSVTIYQVP